MASLLGEYPQSAAIGGVIGFTIIAGLVTGDVRFFCITSTLMTICTTLFVERRGPQIQNWFRVYFCDDDRQQGGVCTICLDPLNRQCRFGIRQQFWTKARWWWRLLIRYKFTERFAIRCAAFHNWQWTVCRPHYDDNKLAIFDVGPLIDADDKDNVVCVHCASRDYFCRACLKQWIVNNNLLPPAVSLAARICFTCPLCRSIIFVGCHRLH